jgi:hypothetical protein
VLVGVSVMGIDVEIMHFSESSTLQVKALTKLSDCQPDRSKLANNLDDHDHDDDDVR